MTETNSQHNLLNLNSTFTITPELTFSTITGIKKEAPWNTNENGFELQLDATLPYEKLNSAVNTFATGKRIVISEGFFNQYIEIDRCLLSCAAVGIRAQVFFSGSFDGSAVIYGTPFYNTAAQKIELRDITYLIETKNFLLKGAKWLFDKLILEELRKRAVFDLAPFYKTVTTQVNALLQKEWTIGVKAHGLLKNIEITAIRAEATQLTIQGRCSGSLQLTISELDFKF